MAYKGFSAIKEQMEKNKSGSKGNSQTNGENEFDDQNQEKKSGNNKRGTAGAAKEKKEINPKRIRNRGTGKDVVVKKDETVSESGDEKVRMNLSEQTALVGGTVRKTIAIPLEMDLAIRELKDRRKLRRKMTNQKGKDTDDDIFLEALSALFGQKGEFAESLTNARVKMQSLS